MAKLGLSRSQSKPAYEAEPEPIKKKKKPKEAQYVEAERENREAQLPKIAVKNHPLVREKVPGSVFRQSAFRFDPMPFGLESNRLDERIIEASVQRNSLMGFMKDPIEPSIYCVSGNPDDLKAKYFAAFLVQEHIRQHHEPRVVWYPMYGGYSNPLVDRDPNLGDPTMIVMTNLTMIATNQKLEKARDILERFADTPRVVVAAGMDPISFMATRLFSPVNYVAYFGDTSVRTRIRIT